MNSYIWNLIELNGLIIVLYGIYLMGRSTISIANRRRLVIGIPLLALLAVTIKSLIPATEVPIEFAVIELSPVVVGAAETSTSFSWTELMGWTYLIGCGVMVSYLILRMIWVQMIFNKSSKNSEGFLVNRDGDESFSFFNRIQIQLGLKEEEEKLILEHEQIHSQKRHSIDLILIELFQALSWPNLVFIGMKRELKKLHEFEVDQVMYERYGVDYMKFLLQQSLGTSSSKYLLTHQFNDPLTLKNRIKTMKTKQRSQKMLVMILPMLALSASLVSLTSVQNPTASISDFNPVFLQDDPVEKVPEKVAEFPGGEEAMFKYFAENVKYPKTAMDNGIEGVVYCQFTVEKDGSLSDIKIVKGKFTSLNEETIRVVKQMPKWKPAENKGKVVRSIFTIPVSYKLPTE